MANTKKNKAQQIRKNDQVTEGLKVKFYFANSVGLSSFLLMLVFSCGCYFILFSAVGPCSEHYWAHSRCLLNVY